MFIFIIVVLLSRFLYVFYNKQIYLIKKNLRETQELFFAIEAKKRNENGFFEQFSLSDI